MDLITKIAIAFVVLAFSAACYAVATLSPADKAEILKAMSEADTSVKAAEPQSGNSSVSGSGSGSVSGNGSTELDNSLSGNNSDGSVANNPASSSSSRYSIDSSIPSINVPPYDGSYSGNPEDFELSVPDDWKNYDGVGDNPNEYPWENDANIPDLGWTITPNPDGIIIGDGDTGQTGEDWSFPAPNAPSLPDIDYNFPDMPNSDSSQPVEYPPDLRFDSDYPNNDD